MWTVGWTARMRSDVTEHGVWVSQKATQILNQRAVTRKIVGGSYEGK